MVKDSNQPLLDNILNTLGTEIIEGRLETGATFTLHDICTRFGISRTVAREAMRALEQLNLVVSSRRVGITVQDRSEWSVFDSSIIKWRLETAEERKGQLQSLTQLRTAVEPVAAASMAEKGTDEQKQRLVELANILRALGESGHGDSKEFLAADIEFHTLILQASNNEMFAALGPTVAAVLDGRTSLGLQPKHPVPEALDRHDALAASVARGDGAASELHSRALLTEVKQVLSSSSPIIEH